jgi:hypothetical protein
VVADSGVLALAVLFQFDEVVPKSPDFFLSGVEVEAAVPSLLEIYEDVEITVAIPIVVVETIRAVIVRVRLDDVDSPPVWAWFADVLFPFRFPVVFLFLTNCGLKEEGYE